MELGFAALAYKVFENTVFSLDAPHDLYDVVMPEPDGQDHICGEGCDCEDDEHSHDDHDHDSHDDHNHADHALNPTPEFSFDEENVAPSDISYSIDPSAPDSGQVGTSTNGLPIWSAYQTAQHIARSGTDYINDGSMVITYSFVLPDDITDESYMFELVNQQHTRDILAQYAQTTGVKFIEASEGERGDINFRYRDGQNGGGYWDGTNVVVSRVGWEPEMDFGTYNRRLMLHEIGHALGLAHPGNYNGNSASYADADHWNDSRQFTNMSYWGEGNTGAAFGHMSTLGLHDILATQIEYGINWDTRSGDSVYGFEANTGEAYDFTSTRTRSDGTEAPNLDMAFSIWDGGGTDTLNFSGSSSGTQIDLREGGFSSVNGQTYNVSIAYRAVIENAVGSAFGDTIMGNNVANLLDGG